MSNYISAAEYYTGRPDDAGILKKLENRFKGYKEIKLNLSDFIRHNRLDMILNNELIRNNNLYFEFYNYDELNDQDRENAISELKDSLTAGYDNLSEYDTINDVFNIYYSGSIENLEDFFKMSISEAIDELTEAIEDYCNDMFYEWNGEIYQYFIIPEYDVDHYWLKYTNYPILYDDETDLYLLGITHWGMSWKYFETSYTIREYL